MRKIFGTDGIRGRANIYPLTSEVALALGRAVAYQARKRTKRPKIIVGKDTRLSCYMLEMALVSGICSMGADALMTGPIPTPGIAYLTTDMRCDAGVMITASHNPYEDNGIKIFGPEGFKLTDEEEEEIEKYILGHYTTEQLVSTDDGSYPMEKLIGKAHKVDDARGRYVAHIKSVVPKSLDLTGMKIAIDCANGAAYSIAHKVFEELGADVMVVGNKPNGTNINYSGATNTAELSHLMKVNAEYSDKLDIGITLDGDADRVVILDENGDQVNGDAVIAHLANEYLHYPHVVGTTMSNQGLEDFLKAREGSLVRTDVGDRYVIEEMRKEDISVGGEPSGHIIMFDYSTTGDGLVAALKLVQYLKENNKKASDLIKEAPMHAQVLINVLVEKKVPIEEMEELDAEMEAVYYEMDPPGRVLVRFSGTSENKLRIMVEHPDVGVATAMANRLLEKVK